MSVSQVCSLCRTTCSEYKSLQTSLDESNEIYNITLKYFNPMLLTENIKFHHNPLLCRDCWFYINKFHEFQRKVLETRVSWKNKSNLKTLLIEVKQEGIQTNVPTTNRSDNGRLVITQDDMFGNNLECRDLKTESLTSCGNTLESIIEPEAIESNVPTSNRSDIGSLNKTLDDEDNPFENNLEYRDLKTELFTSCGNTLASILEQEVPTSNTSDNGSFEKSKDDEDNLFEYNLEYGDLKPESPTRCNANIESILKQTGDKDEENSLALEKDMNSDEHNLTRAKRKLRQGTNSINDTKPSERIKQLKLTEDTKRAKKTNFNMERARESDAIIAEWKSELICDLCSETATNFDKLRSHFKEKHETRLYIKCCERKFYRRYELLNHVQLHLNPETFKCNICGKFSTTKRLLELHKKVMHENTKLLKCTICEKIFRQKFSLKRHMLTHSTRNKDFICSECGKGYVTEQLLKNHIKHVHEETEKPERVMESDALIAEWKSELICDICSEAVPNMGKMRIHFKEKHKKTKFYVICCERKFYQRWFLVQHIQFHLNPEALKCDICGKTSATKRLLGIHKKAVHEKSKPFKCNICEKQFNQKASLNKHNLTHSTSSKDFICSECGKGYINEPLLKYHIKYVHNVDYVCEQCGKNIHGSQALKIHLMEHAGIERPNFPCDVCGIKLQTAYGLRRHKSVYHNDDSTIYVCGVCGKVLANEFSLLNHKRLVHATERKHKCTYCDKTFTRPMYLREHIATHTGEDLYQCPHCPEKFKVNSRMHDHRKRKHPVEWEEARKNRPQCVKTNNNQVKKHIAIY